MNDISLLRSLFGLDDIESVLQMLAEEEADVMARMPTRYRRSNITKAFLKYSQPFETNPPRFFIAGVYAFWKGGYCLYVGQSQNISQRMEFHERRREAQMQGCTITWLGCVNHINAERWLIEALQPLYNGIRENSRSHVARQIPAEDQDEHVKQYRVVRKQKHGAEMFELFFGISGEALFEKLISQPHI